MKKYLILYISAFSIIFSNCYDIQITSILTDKVASDGMLILNTTGMNFAVKDFKIILNNFNLIIKNEGTNEETSLGCFLYQFTYISRESAKMCCLTKGLAVGRYSINPLKKTTGYYRTGFTININPFNIIGTFQIENGKDIYFYDLPGNTYVNLYREYDCSKIEFSLFEYHSDIEDTKVFFDDIPIDCFYHGAKLECPIKAEKFNQTKYQRYTLYLQNRKVNYFLHQVSISLYYIKELS